MSNRVRQIDGEKSSSTSKTDDRPGGRHRRGKPGPQGLLQMARRDNPSSSNLRLTPQNILYLQRTIGNRQVTNLLQAKLQVSQPEDEYEREADHVAERVLRMPDQAAAGGGQTVGGHIQRLNPKDDGPIHRETAEDERRKRADESAVQMKSILA